MAEGSYEFLKPIVKSEGERRGIDFHLVPAAQTNIPKIDLPLDHNPLKLDNLAINNFRLWLPE